MGFTAPGPYRIPNVTVQADCVYTNTPPNGAFRGYGATQVVWASELAMDLLAERLGIDPLDLRLKNVLRDGDTYATGEVVRDVHFADCLEAAARAVRWGEGQQGKGLCVLMKGMQTPSRASVAVEATGDGRFVVQAATTEMGQGSMHALAAMAAEYLGVDPSRVRCARPDTDITPYDTRTTSSRSTHMMSRALAEAVRDLREGGGARGFGEISNPGGLDPDTGQGVASSHWHQGAAAAEVRVDSETGVVEVVRLHAAVYAGRVVNRPGAELQNEGSMLMGLGTALFEDVVLEGGQVTNANLSDYEVPTTADLPGEMTHELVEREGAEVHGLGETAVPPVPAAIGNALASLGIHVTRLPMTPETVLDAIDRRNVEAPA
jgi:CO/xanthine dehydrogenase Mo-binding subunit